MSNPNHHDGSDEDIGVLLYRTSRTAARSRARARKAPAALEPPNPPAANYIPDPTPSAEAVSDFDFESAWASWAIAGTTQPPNPCVPDTCQSSKTQIQATTTRSFRTAKKKRVENNSSVVFSVLQSSSEPCSDFLKHTTDCNAALVNNNAATTSSRRPPNPNPFVAEAFQTQATAARNRSCHSTAETTGRTAMENLVSFQTSKPFPDFNPNTKLANAGRKPRQVDSRCDSDAHADNKIEKDNNSALPRFTNHPKQVVGSDIILAQFKLLDEMKHHQQQQQQQPQVLTEDIILKMFSDVLFHWNPNSNNLASQNHQNHCEEKRAPPPSNTTDPVAAQFHSTVRQDAPKQVNPWHIPNYSKSAPSNQNQSKEQQQQQQQQQQQRTILHKTDTAIVLAQEHSYSATRTTQDSPKQQQAANTWRDISSTINELAQHNAKKFGWAVAAYDRNAPEIRNMRNAFRKSMRSQAKLQEWDKNMGNGACRTMTMSNQSRKRLLATWKN